MSVAHQPEPSFVIEEPDISHVTISDGRAVQNLTCEKQMRLLAVLLDAWPGPPSGTGEPRPFTLMTDVGLFPTPEDTFLVPDAMLSVDTRVHPDFRKEKKHQAYFVWVMGKAPDVVIELVSNRKGDEHGKRKAGYARARVTYYVVWDPEQKLTKEELVAYELSRGDYVRMMDARFPELGLSLAPWEGEFEGVHGHWLRWFADGVMVPTGPEQAQAERERAQAERERAETEHERAERLAALLRAHGIDPDAASD